MWCSAADKDLKPVDRVVSGASLVPRTSSICYDNMHAVQDQV